MCSTALVRRLARPLIMPFGEQVDEQRHQQRGVNEHHWHDVPAQAHTSVSRRVARHLQTWSAGSRMALAQRRCLHATQGRPAGAHCEYHSTSAQMHASDQCGRSSAARRHAASRTVAPRSGSSSGRRCLGACMEATPGLPWCRPHSEVASARPRTTGDSSYLCTRSRTRTLVA
jgi:hypothetical protein